MAEHKIVRVTGGTVESAGALAGAALAGGNGTDLPPSSKYERWLRGVAANPVPIRQTLRPICDLIASARTAEKEVLW